MNDAWDNFHVAWVDLWETMKREAWAHKWLLLAIQVEVVLIAALWEWWR